MVCGEKGQSKIRVKIGDLFSEQEEVNEFNHLGNKIKYMENVLGK